MSFKKALLMLLIVLGGGVLLAREIQFSKEELVSKARDGLPEKFFSDFKPALVERISVVAPKGQYSFERSNSVPKVGKNASAWVLAQPHGAPVDPERLQKLFGILESLVSKNSLNEEEVDSQTDYGLKPAEMTVSFVGPNLPKMISIGKLHPLSHRRYAQKAGDTRLFLLDPELFELLNVPAQELRDRHPLRMDLKSLSSLVISRPNAAEVTFAKDPKTGIWMATSPNSVIPLDAKLLQQRLALFTNVKAEEFLDQGNDTSSLTGLSEPVLKIHFLSADGTLDCLLEIGETLGLAAKQVYFRFQGSPFVYRARGAFHADFIRPVDSFRDCHPLRDTEKKELLSVSIKYGEGPAILFPATDTARWNSLSVSQFIEFLLFVEVLNFEPPTLENIHLAGLDAPEGMVEVELSPRAASGGETRKFRLLIGKEISGENTVAPSPGPSGKLRPDGKPRWLGIQAEDGILRPAVLGGVQAEEFLRLLEAARKSSSVAEGVGSGTAQSSAKQ